MTTGYLPMAGSWAQQAPGGYYPGATVAGFTPNTQNSWDTGMSAAGDIQRVGQYGADQWATSMGYGKAGNPYLDEQVQNMQDQAWQGFNRNVMPGVTNDAIDAGQMGGSRHGIAQGIRQGDMGRAVTDATQDMYSNAWDQGLNFQANMMSLAPGMMSQYNESRMTPFRMQQDIGAQQQGMNQSRMDAGQNRWNYNRDAPGQKIQQYGSMVNPGAYAGYGDTTSPNQSYQNPWQAAAGGAMAGASIANNWG